MGIIKNIKFAKATAKLGKKLLDDLEEHYEKFGKYVEELKTEQEQTIAVYLYCIKILDGLDEENRDEVIKNISLFNFSKLKVSKQKDLYSWIPS